MAKDKNSNEEKRLQEAFEFSDAIIATVREPLVVLYKELRVITANRSFYRTFKVNLKETETYDGNRTLKAGLEKGAFETFLIT